MKYIVKIIISKFNIGSITFDDIKSKKSNKFLPRIETTSNIGVVDKDAKEPKTIYIIKLIKIVLLLEKLNLSLIKTLLTFIKLNKLPRATSRVRVKKAIKNNLPNFIFNRATGIVTNNNPEPACGLKP